MCRSRGGLDRWEGEMVVQWGWSVEGGLNCIAVDERGRKVDGILTLVEDGQTRDMCRGTN